MIRADEPYIAVKFSQKTIYPCNFEFACVPAEREGVFYLETSGYHAEEYTSEEEIEKVIKNILTAKKKLLKEHPNLVVGRMCFDRPTIIVKGTDTVIDA